MDENYSEKSDPGKCIQSLYYFNFGNKKTGKSYFTSLRNIHIELLTDRVIQNGIINNWQGN